MSQCGGSERACAEDFCSTPTHPSRHQLTGLSIHSGPRFWLALCLYWLLLLPSSPAKSSVQWVFPSTSISRHVEPRRALGSFRVFVVIDRKHNDESLQKQCIKEQGRQEAGLEAAGLPVGAAIRSLAGVTLSVGDRKDSAPGTEPQVRPQAEQKSVVES